MDLKQKLKDLLKNSGLDESTIDNKIEEMLPSEQPGDAAEEDVPPPTVVNLDYEEVERIIQLQEQLRLLKEGAGVLLLRFEEAKDNVRNMISENLLETKEEINRLREDFGLPLDVDYELNLPSNPDEMGSFVIAKK